VSADSCLVRAHFLAFRWSLLAVSSAGGRDEEALGSLFNGIPKAIPKGSPSNTSTLGVRFSE
jgi:hypothetical protein